MKTNRHLHLIVAFLLSLSLSLLADVTLVQDGKPLAAILLGEKPTRSAQLGAFELQYHIQLITGATLPICTDKVPDGTAVTIRVGGENEKLTEEASIIKFRPNEILITGGDTQDFTKVDYAKYATFPPVEYHWKGSLFAVYDFLEDYCGVRFYGMDPLDTTYKKRATLTVAEKDRNFVSKMDAFRDCYDDFYPKGHLVQKTPRDHALWKLRWRCSVTYGKTNHNTVSIYFAHWGKAKDPYLEKAFISKRPELFAKGYEGKGASCGAFLEQRFPNDPDLPPQLCYTNPDTVDFFAREAQTYYHGKNVPGGWCNIRGMAPADKCLLPRFPGKPFYYPYEGNDSGLFCLCPECRKLAKDNNFSETKFRFLNAMAKRCKELEPSEEIGMSTLAYGSTLPCPNGLTIEKNTSVQLCLVNYAWWHPVVAKRNLENLKEWRKLMGNQPLTLWLYVYGPQHDARVHYGNYKPFPALYPWKMGEQMKTYIQNNIKGIFSEYKMPFNFLEAYIVSKMSYDTSLDPNKIISDYFKDYYGNAAPYMEAIYREIENAMRYPEFTPKEWRKDPRVAYGDNDKVFSPWWPTNMWTREMNYRLGTPERIARINTFLAKADAIKKTPEETERIKRFVDALWKPALEGRREYELYLKQKELPRRTLLLTPIADILDGDAQKVDWNSVQPTEKWLDATGKDIGSTATVRTAVDSKYFYCKFEEQRKPVLDYGVWSENVEFFFTADGKYPLYHFAKGPQTDSKPIGFIYELINDTDLQKDYDFQAKTVSIPTDTSWTLYIAIPRDRLPIKGNTMFLDFFRMRHDGKQWDVSCWQPVYSISGGKGMDGYGKLFILPFTVQQSDFKYVWPNQASGVVDDSEASDGKAAYLLCKYPWYLSYPIPAVFPKGKMDIYARVRVEAKEADYIVIGGHDWTAKKSLFVTKIPCKDMLGKTYKEVKLTSIAMHEEQSVYFSGIFLANGQPIKNDQDKIYIDYLRFESTKE